MTASDTEPTVGSLLTLQALENEKFVVGKVLKGGMGVVYQLVPVRPVGIPPLALKTYQETADRAQFIREAEVWISLGTYPHVAHALAYTEWHSRPSVVADWYDKSLAETDIRNWPTSKIVTFALQLIDGLSYAVDSAKVVHQDIKPANILLDNSDAPCISDFGLAKFAPDTLALLGRIQDVQPTMSHAVSLGDVVGTPLYMAPELFLGVCPSTRTDIFSLGVTLYGVLTCQHPFIGSETGHRWQPLLREAPIQAVFKERGAEISPLLALIVAALELNPERRPVSYDVLLAEAGLHSEKAAPRRTDVVNDVITKAVMFREQGRHQEALLLFRNALEERPTNLLLLNSYAVLLKSLGKNADARAAWKLAVESLAFASGKYEHVVYLEPAVNLAGQMITAKEFSGAEALLRKAQQWTDGQPPLLVDYAEFGWWYLYKGQFEDACSAILAVYKSKAPDEVSLFWLTLSAWLSGRFSELAAKLAEYYLMLPRFSAPIALNACVVASYCRDPEAKKLLDRAYRDAEVELNDVARNLGLQPPILKPPLHMAVSKSVIRSLDVWVTGGKYSELIG